MKSRAFTLIEIIVTIAVMAIVLAFAIPNWGRALSKQNERNVKLQLMNLNMANDVYSAQTGQYLAGTHNNANISDLNDALRTDILLENRTFTYTPANGNTTYTATLSWTEGAATKTIRVNERALSDTAGSANPCCSTDNGIIIPGC